jgi:hypothetical protein
MKRKTASLSLLLVASLSIGIVSCKKEGCTDPEANNFSEKAKKDDGSCTYDATPVTEEVVKGEIASNTTWKADKIYLLDGKVVVKSGVTLTIEPGTIIKGKQGQETLASALVVARGGKIMAVGTADKPIIFTSELDNIKIGEKVGTNLTKTDNEKWGGVVILGYAPISAQNGDTETNIEGIPVSAGYGLYGGTNAADNSGMLKYVSIRHCGITIGEGNELNALTLGGVGSGTEIENVEIYATLDDGIECFGGTVSIKNALVYYQGDDGIDLDMNYSGTIENFIVIHGDGIATDKGLEIDGPENSTYTTGLFTLLNGLVKSEGVEGTAADFKDKAQGTIQNVTFDYSSQTGGSKIKIRAKYDAANSCTPQTDAFTRLMEDKLKFINSKWGATQSQVYTAVTDCAASVPTSQTAANVKFVEGTGSTVSTSLFSWTCASLRGQL